MNTAKREFIEGLGLSILALGFSGFLLYGAWFWSGQASYARAAIFGVPGLVALYWSIRFTRSQFLAYIAQKDR